MGHSTITGYWRQRGDGKASSYPGVTLLAMPFEQVLTATGGSHSIGTLPKGAIPLFTQSWGGSATVGAPQVNIGSATEGVVLPSDGIVQGLVTNAYSGFTAGGTDGGVKLGVPFAKQAELYIVNATPTGGAILAHTASGAVYYIMDDDASQNPA